MTAVSQPAESFTREARRYTLALDAASDPRIVGGKAHALGRVIGAGIPVPPGFVLNTAALDDHLDAHNLRRRISVLCEGVDHHDSERVAECSRGIRGLVTGVPLSESLRAELFTAAEPLLALGAVVVRSSAIGEDGLAQSFAGQLDSILHVSSLSSLEHAVLACWASFWSERALFYRAARGVVPNGMGIVVQQQVAPRFSGVLFTNAGDETMLVEYTAGLADALVSGAIEPSRLAVDRKTGAVRQLTAEHAEHAEHAEVPSLDVHAGRVLAATGEALERVFGVPQDVEWALDHAGAMWIVQSRAITAPIVAQREPVEPSGPRRRIVWSNANVNENFPRPISPLLYSIAAPGYTHYFRNLARAFGIAPRRVRAMEPAFRQIIGVHGARMYYNLTSIHSVLRLAPFGKALAAAFDTFVGANGTDVEAETLDARRSLKQSAEVVAIAAKTAWQFAFLPRRIVRFEAVVNSFAERTRPERLARMSGVELRDALREFMDIRCHRWLDASLADAASMICYGALERLLKNAYGAETASHTALLKAIPGVISGEPVRRLWVLSRHIRDDASLRTLFESEPSPVVLEHVRHDPRFSRFRTELDAYLEDWGFRCSEELMLTSPSFQEDPEPLIDMLRAYARLEAASPDDAVREQESARLGETQRVLDELRHRSLWRGAPAPTYGQLLKVLLPWTHSAIRFRERARMKQALLYSRCRRIALAIGVHLGHRGIIDSAGDVFFLTVPEIDELLSGAAMLPRAIRELVRVRRAEHAVLAATTPPDAFTLEEGAYLDSIAPPNPPALNAVSASRTLHGTSACAGRATGRAAVLRDVTEAARLVQGDVLVTRQTDPGWGPVFFLIAGLVIERGGMLSHGAIIAREFGIPCVVAVRDAMATIADGATITVDGNAGQVHVDA